MSEEIPASMQQLEDCYQNLKILQGKLRTALSAAGDPTELPSLIDTRKKELELLQKLDLELEKAMLLMPEAEKVSLKTALIEFGQRFELLASNEQDILRTLEEQSIQGTDIHDKKSPDLPAGGKLDVSQ